MNLLTLQGVQVVLTGTVLSGPQRSASCVLNVFVSLVWSYKNLKSTDNDGKAHNNLDKLKGKSRFSSAIPLKHTLLV